MRHRSNAGKVIFHQGLMILSIASGYIILGKCRHRLVIRVIQWDANYKTLSCTAYAHLIICGDSAGLSEIWRLKTSDSDVYKLIPALEELYMYNGHRPITWVGLFKRSAPSPIRSDRQTTSLTLTTGAPHSCTNGRGCGQHEYSL